MLPQISQTFPRYQEHNPLVPIWCVTPNAKGTTIRFNDTSAISPSGKYIALTEMPYENRQITPGDSALVIVIDLETGEKTVIAETRGWDSQLGAQVQWGVSDAELFYNDMDTQTWKPYAIKMNFLSRHHERMDGPIYMVSAAGTWGVSPCLLRTGKTQAGYGVVAPEENIPCNFDAPSDDGIYTTNLKTGKTDLFISLQEIYENVCPALNKDEYTNGGFYGAHTKWNPQTTRIMFVLRWIKPDGSGMKRHLIIIDTASKKVYMPVSDSVWRKGGHHPVWCQDGEHILMNLKVDGVMRFVKMRYDDTSFQSVTTRMVGSGHPSFDRQQRYIVTDTYLNEDLAYGDGTTPIRLIDTREDREHVVARIRSKPDEGVPPIFRVDPHPAWDFSCKRIAFNACPYGTKQVFIADLQSVLEK